RAIIENSLIVADAYMQEQALVIHGAAIPMAFDVARAKPLFDGDRERFKQFLLGQTQVRGLSAAAMIGSDGAVIERTGIKTEQSFPMPDAASLANVTESDPKIAVFLSANAVAAVIKLRGYDNTYLYVVRSLDPRVVSQVRETQETVADFASLQSRRFG